MPEPRHVIRQQKLRALVDAAKRRGMTQRAYAMQVLGHKDDKYLSQLLRPLGTKGARNIGDEAARDLDKALKMPGHFAEITPEVDEIREARALTEEEIRLMVLRELTRSLVANAPAVAEGFSALLRESAVARHFETDTGLIGVVLDTVALGQSSAAAAIRRASQVQFADLPKPKTRAPSRRS